MQVEFLYILLRLWCPWQLRPDLFAAGFALGSNTTANCSNTTVYVGVTIFALCDHGVVLVVEATRILSATGVGIFDRSRERHVRAAARAYQGKWCIRMEKFVQFCRSQSRYMLRDSDCNVWFITSSLYSYIERLRPLNTQSLALSLLLCTFTNQVLAELDLLWYWKETTTYKMISTPCRKRSVGCGCLAVKSER